MALSLEKAPLTLTVLCRRVEKVDSINRLKGPDYGKVPVEGKSLRRPMCRVRASMTRW